jgi:hypothetical protein
VRFDPLDATSVEIYFQGKSQGVARLVDPVVNGQIPSPKPFSPAAPEPTGINFVELLHDQKDDEERIVSAGPHQVRTRFVRLRGPFG